MEVFFPYFFFFIFFLRQMYFPNQWIKFKFPLQFWKKKQNWIWIFIRNEIDSTVAPSDVYFSLGKYSKPISNCAAERLARHLYKMLYVSFHPFERCHTWMAHITHIQWLAARIRMRATRGEKITNTTNTIACNQKFYRSVSTWSYFQDVRRSIVLRFCGSCSTPDSNK